MFLLEVHRRIILLGFHIHLPWQLRSLNTLRKVSKMLLGRPGVLSLCCNNNLCFTCGKSGHFSTDCPTKVGGKKPFGKKKYSPSQLWSHIRSLIDDNFDGEEDEDYQTFIEEVEEQGF